MTETLTTKQRPRLAVIVTEFGAAVNVGGSPEVKVRVFDLPPEIADYIIASRGQWTTLHFGIEDSQ